MKFFAPVAALALALALANAAVDSRNSKPVDARTTEANITKLTSGLLEHSQFSHHPLDNELAGKFLDRFLDALDVSRLLFLQSDLDEFAPLRATLAQATRRTGDDSAERAIFDRYLERLGQRVTFVTNALETATFDFTGNDVYSFGRDKAARPPDLAAAHELWMQQLRAEYLQEKLGGKPPQEIGKTLTGRYVQLLRTMREMNHDEVQEIYLDALAHVYDPHSDYLGHEQMESLAISMNLSLFGIGATLDTLDGYCHVRVLVPGGPAARSGLLKSGDRIVAVAQADKDFVDIVNMPLTRAVDLIRGPKGSTVRLTIIPSGAGEEAARKTITLVRDEVKLEDEQAKARIVDLPVGEKQTFRVGVIDLPSFYADIGGKHGGGHRSATADVAQLIGKLKEENVRGIILDLRINGGGALEEAINLTGLFIPKGPVVQTKDADGDIDVNSSSRSKPLYDGPMIVLTSRYSASASEILAGALQDYGRALIVGDSSTFGKGTVQDILPLARIMDANHLGHSFDPGALKVTIRKFYRPSGASTQLRGVAADIVVPSPSEVSGVSESSMKDPLPWDIIPAARFKSLDRVQRWLPELRSESATRVAGEPGFVFLHENVARLKRNLEDKTVSLNEAARREEMAQTKARQTTYDAEMTALHRTPPATYDITLKNATVPGLPPPEKFTNSTAVAKMPAAPGREDDFDLGVTEHSPSRDLILAEAEHIMADYAARLSRQTQTVATPL